MSRKLTTLMLMLMTLMAKAQTCPDEHHPHAIDMGLASGTLWACCNIDANSPEECGGYYAWGETEEKEEFTYENYIHSDGTWDTCHNLGDSISGTDYDVARAKWGEVWRMPSPEQINELIEHTAYIWTIVNQTQGALFKGMNKNCIFLPAAGRRDTSFSYRNVEGHYWSGTPSPYGSFYAHHLGFGDSWVVCLENGGRKNGLPVRPVTDFASDIRQIPSAKTKHDESVYSIYGLKVGNISEGLQHLKPGLYIVKGKIVRL
ncbi:MAG: hypothetical protein J6Y97_11030 [Prevotella sp.]|nr:hypothetical protein [Prevotella sp.]